MNRSRNTRRRGWAARRISSISRANSNEKLIEVVSAAWAEGISVRVLGGGANVLVSDAGFRGLVVINRVGKAAFNETTVTVTAGMSLTVLARKCAAQGLSGLRVGGQRAGDGRRGGGQQRRRAWRRYGGLPAQRGAG